MAEKNMRIDHMGDNLFSDCAVVGIELMQKKNYEKAISVFNEIMDSDIEDAKVNNSCLWNLGVCQIILERWTDAAYTFSRFLEGDPGALREQARNNFMIASHKAHQKRDIRVQINENCIFINDILKRPVNGKWLRRWVDDEYTYNDADLCTLIETRFAAPKDTPFIFYDIGANIGMFSLYAATAPDGDIRVHAFEPNPVAFSELTAFAEAEGVRQRITIHNIALSDQAQDSVRLYTPVKDTPELSRLDGVHPFLSPGEWISYDVDVRRLDDLDLPSPHLIKIDVEDHEYQVIKGGRRTIATARPVIFFENWYYGFNFLKTFRPLAAMESLGYRLFTPVWKVKDDDREYFTLNGPKYGDDLARYTLCLNPINIQTRPDYPENTNIIAVPAEKIGL